MRFMLLIYSSPDARQEVTREHVRLRAELAESGEWMGGDELAGDELAHVVRVRDGAAVVGAGAYRVAGDRGEHLAGYELIDCDSLERALEIAARLPQARVCGVEVRPLMHPGGLEM
ncbi:hypothetical protein HNP84_008938 [Thermocatellispora tengchongensis]|uniref:YCII-related domain-containing protein n=1 Tax=Thermocatellispora tengchongensis TaxID=1073253 RepID=A0A840PTB4_9ACTN|nr:YciI family protein [Thermocatellispora tengchongensis]MBB5139175.1 hypothetical protein [Thermocatellispora tengchongensis]